MKERPILFGAPMVRAILEGRKTQTRRVVKPLPEMVVSKAVVPWSGEPAALLRLLEQKGRTCPYGQPGDQLWVREAWAYFGGTEYLYQQEIGSVRYREGHIGDRVPGGHWRPSIHMPRWASRILLEVVSVRVERLQDISRGDAMAEGCPFPNMAGGPDPRTWFRELWESINGAGSWDANPWVWVVESKVVKP